MNLRMLEELVFPRCSETGLIQSISNLLRSAALVMLLPHRSDQLGIVAELLVLPEWPHDCLVRHGSALPVDRDCRVLAVRLHCDHDPLGEPLDNLLAVDGRGFRGVL